MFLRTPIFGRQEFCVQLKWTAEYDTPICITLALFDLETPFWRFLIIEYL